MGNLILNHLILMATAMFLVAALLMSACNADDDGQTVPMSTSIPCRINQETGEWNHKKKSNIPADRQKQENELCNTKLGVNDATCSRSGWCTRLVQQAPCCTGQTGQCVRFKKNKKPTAEDDAACVKLGYLRCANSGRCTSVGYEEHVTLHSEIHEETSLVSSWDPTHGAAKEMLMHGK